MFCLMEFIQLAPPEQRGGWKENNKTKVHFLFFMFFQSRAVEHNERMDLIFDEGMFVELNDGYYNGEEIKFN